MERREVHLIPFRSILIQVDDVTEFVSFGFNIYSNDKTILAIAIDDPELMHGRNIVLGELRNDCLWYMDSMQIVQLLTNLIKYALIRDKYRKEFKESAFDNK